jgi:hypothetical protein
LLYISAPGEIVFFVIGFTNLFFFHSSQKGLILSGDIFFLFGLFFLYDLLIDLNGETEIEEIFVFVLNCDLDFERERLGVAVLMLLIDLFE